MDPDDIQTELEYIDKEYNYEGDRFGLSMLSLLGIIFIAIGLARIVMNGSISNSILEISLTVLGFAILVFASIIRRRERPTDEMIEAIRKKEQDQYRYLSGTTGFGSRPRRPKYDKEDYYDTSVLHKK